MSEGRYSFQLSRSFIVTKSIQDGIREILSRSFASEKIPDSDSKSPLLIALLTISGTGKEVYWYFVVSVEKEKFFFW